MFCGGTIFGLVKAIAVWPVARPAMALATANRLSGRSGQSAMLSYAEMNWSVWYWLSTGAGTV
ncbi:Uncharacterised protein [Mycobacteroides abscessus subsp. massiliense]|nr:Uncharacterised protein [Mycobacteroides abscessus subsp. massiliense]